MAEKKNIRDSDILNNLGNGFMVLYHYNDSWHMKTATYGYPYGYLWSAKFYGAPSKRFYRHIENWCIMNMTNGLIVWRSWEQTSP